MKDELKTLEDFEREWRKTPYSYTANFVKDQLKQEAIKWIKRADKEHCDLGDDDWMNFFNITEEELTQ